MASVTVTVPELSGLPPVSVDITAETLSKVSFNPSDKPAVVQIRVLTAAIITVLNLSGQPGVPLPARDVVIASYLDSMNKAIAFIG